MKGVTNRQATSSGSTVPLRLSTPGGGERGRRGGEQGEGRGEEGEGRARGEEGEGRGRRQSTARDSNSLMIEHIFNNVVAYLDIMKQTYEIIVHTSQHDRYSYFSC